MTYLSQTGGQQKASLVAAATREFVPEDEKCLGIRPELVGGCVEIITKTFQFCGSRTLMFPVHVQSR